MPSRIDEDFEAERDARALREAEEIRADNTRVDAAREAAERQLKALEAVTQEPEPALEKGFTSLGKMDMGG